MVASKSTRSWKPEQDWHVGIEQTKRVGDSSPARYVVQPIAINARPNFRHPVDEQRFIAIERNQNGQPIFTAFTFLERDGVLLIRPVSARYLHKEEVAKYEKSIFNTN